MNSSSSPRRRAALWLAAMGTLALSAVGSAVLAQTDSSLPPTASPSAADSPLIPAEPIAAEGQIPMKNLLQVMRDGGPLMIPIGLCSVILLVFVFERSILRDEYVLYLFPLLQLRLSPYSFGRVRHRTESNLQDYVLFVR